MSWTPADCIATAKMVVDVTKDAEGFGRLSPDERMRINRAAKNYAQNCSVGCPSPDQLQYSTICQMTLNAQLDGEWSAFCVIDHPDDAQKKICSAPVSGRTVEATAENWKPKIARKRGLR